MHKDEILALNNDELNALVTATFFEPEPETKTVRELRDLCRADWRYSEFQFHSPLEFWYAKIGTDLDLNAAGMYSAIEQDEPCQWLPANNFPEYAGDAFAILSKMKERGWNSSVEIHENYCVCTIWSQRMNEHGPYPVTRQAKTVPLAVCQATLFVALVEKSSDAN